MCSATATYDEYGQKEHINVVAFKRLWTEKLYRIKADKTPEIEGPKRDGCVDTREGVIGWRRTEQGLEMVRRGQGIGERDEGNE